MTKAMHALLWRHLWCRHLAAKAGYVKLGACLVGASLSEAAAKPLAPGTHPLGGGGRNEVTGRKVLP